MLIVSSLATYGLLLAGWRNSKYAFFNALKDRYHIFLYLSLQSSPRLFATTLFFI